jgi:hypothetical protein
MARYRALQDMWLGISFPYVTAGDILQDGPGGNIPSNWVPNGAVDPIDGPALTAFWNAGPQFCGLINSRWSYIGPPTTFWKPVPGTASPNKLYSLTGLGASLPPAWGGS